MAEKKLQLTFATDGGGETNLTLTMAKQDLTADSAKTAMDNMVASQAFANSKGEAYTQAIRAAYIETIETELFSV